MLKIVQSDKEINSIDTLVPGEGVSGRPSGHAAVRQPVSARRLGKCGISNIVRCMIGLMMNGVTDLRGRHWGLLRRPPS